MTESSDAPSDTPEIPMWTTETPKAQPSYPYSHGPYFGGYPAQPQFYAGYPPPPVAPKNGLGTASLLIAIAALLSVWSVLGGVILGIVAAAIGLAAHGRVKRGAASNGGVAVTGIVLGIVSIVVGLIFIPVWVGLILAGIKQINYDSCMEKAGPDKYLQQMCAE